MISAAEFTLRYLKSQGVEHVFGIPGALNSELYDPFVTAMDAVPSHVLVRSELGGGWMADGYARAGGDIGVLLTVPGPGLTHAASAIAGATADCSRLLVISSGNPLTLRTRHRRDLFHGLDGEHLCAGITVWNEVCRSAGDLPLLLASAIRRLRSGRPGAAHLEVPCDLWSRSLDAGPDSGGPVTGRQRTPDPEAVEKAAHLAARARHPVILAGSGVQHHQAEAPLLQLAQRLRAPIITSSGGKGGVDERNDWSLGDSNSRAGVEAYRRHDLLIAAGCRFTQVDTRWDWFFPPRSLIHLDSDSRVTDACFAPSVAPTGDLGLSLQALARRVAGENCLSEWEPEMEALRAAHSGGDRDPVLCALRAALPDDGQIALDVSMSGFYGRRDWRVTRTGRYFYPTTYVGMGFGVPAAVGAALACPGRPTVALTGDGCIQMTSGELSTLADLQLPVVVVAVNDNGFEQIRRCQERRHQGRFVAVDARAPDFELLAQAYRLNYRCCTDPAELQSAAAGALEKGGPWLIEFKICERYLFGAR